MNGTRTAVIIGGGIAGPVTALALRRAGIEATVYEAYETTADGVGGMLMIAPNGLAALDIVGAAGAVTAIGEPTRRMVIAGAKGKRLGEFAGLPGLPPGRTMWRAELYRALHDHAVAQGIRIEYGKRLTGVEDGTDGITARFSDGSSAHGDVLIGADGLRSTVRTMIDPDAPGPEYVGLLGFGGYSSAKTPDTPDAMYFAQGTKAFLGYWANPGGGTAWFSNLPSERMLSLAETRAVPKEDWMRQLRASHADDRPGRELVENTSTDGLMVMGPLEILPSVPHWHRGRMVLVGDSAHAPSSSSGQGASLAAESAVQLARCLRDLPDVESAFAAYENLRRPRVTKVAARAAKLNSQKAAGPVARAVAGALMPIAMKFVKPEKALGYEQSYRIDWDAPVAATAGVTSGR